jgi:hypothetical protein
MCVARMNGELVINLIKKLANCSNSREHREVIISFNSRSISKICWNHHGVSEVFVRKNTVENKEIFVSLNFCDLYSTSV